jgi:hypothetical protein
MTTKASSPEAAQPTQPLTAGSSTHDAASISPSSCRCQAGWHAKKPMCPGTSSDRRLTPGSLPAVKGSRLSSQRPAAQVRYDSKQQTSASGSEQHSLPASTANLLAKLCRGRDSALLAAAPALEAFGKDVGHRGVLP